MLARSSRRLGLPDMRAESKLNLHLWGNHFHTYGTGPQQALANMVRMAKSSAREIRRKHDDKDPVERLV
jgi:hypothetical protein